ncbi:MAG: alanine racemase [Anaerolinea sp.]|nr:alanine racemase [Anaerolinea sp.]
MNVLDSIDQPTLMLDDSVVRKNIEYMLLRAREKKVSFRPHFKTHQSAQIGEWFREKGVSKITVSSVEMAEYFAANGWHDITIAFSLNLRQIKRIISLAKRIHLEVLIENEEALTALSKINETELGVLVKIDVGNHRTGLDWQEVSTAALLCQKIRENPRLKCMGVLTHSGHTYNAGSKHEVRSIFREGVERLTLMRLALEGKGINELSISVGDTPGCSLCEDWSGIDEVRLGNFVFYDAAQALAGSCDFKAVSIALACPVVAKHHARREVVVYGGAIHLSKDFFTINGEKSFGLPALQCGDRWGSPMPEAIVKGLSQEHGILHIPGAEFDRISVGDLVFVLPAHSCLTVQVMGHYLTLKGERITTLNQK